MTVQSMECRRIPRHPHRAIRSSRVHWDPLQFLPPSFLTESTLRSGCTYTENDDYINLPFLSLHRALVHARGPAHSQQHVQCLNHPEPRGRRHTTYPSHPRSITTNMATTPVLTKPTYRSRPKDPPFPIHLPLEMSRTMTAIGSLAIHSACTLQSSTLRHRAHHRRRDPDRCAIGKAMQPAKKRPTCYYISPPHPLRPIPVPRRDSTPLRLLLLTQRPCRRR